MKKPFGFKKKTTTPKTNRTPNKSHAGFFGGIFKPKEDTNKEATAPYKSNYSWNYDGLVGRRAGSSKALMSIQGNETKGTCTNIQFLSRSEKIQWYKALFRAIAYAESGYNPNSTPKYGIMQLSCAKNNEVAVYGCNCKSNHHHRTDSAMNVNCAVNIIEYHMAKNRGIFFNGDRQYFETLMGSASKVRKMLKHYMPKRCKSSY
jgi:hypothetical protein